MNQQIEKIAHYVTVNKELNLGLSEELITKVTVGLGLKEEYKQKG